MSHGSTYHTGAHVTRVCMSPRRPAVTPVFRVRAGCAGFALHGARGLFRVVTSIMHEGSRELGLSLARVGSQGSNSAEEMGLRPRTSEQPWGQAFLRLLNCFTARQTGRPVRAPAHGPDARVPPPAAHVSLSPWNPGLRPTVALCQHKCRWTGTLDSNYCSSHFGKKREPGGAPR